MARKALGGMVAAGSIFYMAILFAQGMLEGKDEEEIWDRILEGFGWTEDPITRRRADGLPMPKVYDYY